MRICYESYCNPNLYSGRKGISAFTVIRYLKENYVVFKISTVAKLSKLPDDNLLTSLSATFSLPR
jgi:hypothetical protein